MTLNVVTATDARYLCGSWASWFSCRCYQSMYVVDEGSGSEPLGM